MQYRPSFQSPQPRIRSELNQELDEPEVTGHAKVLERRSTLLVEPVEVNLLAVVAEHRGQRLGVRGLDGLGKVLLQGDIEL